MNPSGPISGVTSHENVCRHLRSHTCSSLSFSTWSVSETGVCRKSDPLVFSPILFSGPPTVDVF